MDQEWSKIGAGKCLSLTVFRFSFDAFYFAQYAD